MTEKNAAEPLLNIDAKVRKVFKPYRKSAPVRAIGWLSEIGDQPQLRLLSAGLLALGLARGDLRMARAGARMLAAHELATITKNAIKLRVDRSRPRSAGPDGHKPRAGRKTAKEETSFPSGHSAGAMAVASAFAAEYPHHRTAALSLAAGVALAQIPRCAHYPSDVGAGMALGAASSGAVGAALALAQRALALLAPAPLTGENAGLHSH